MNPAISVITCTHNPRKDYLEKVLVGLKSQTLPIEKWEFLLIDNASKELLCSKIDLSWHPNARHIREEKLGLTNARLRGIREVRGEILVFVDDDNVLDSNYLENTWQIGCDWSILGAWGGQIRPEFEVEPPEWTKPYWAMLAIREFDTDRWSNLVNQHITTPCGAGLCVRKIVAQEYAKLIAQDSKRAELDRKGNLLTSCGDSDLAFTACDLNLGTGQFKLLGLTHLIPSSRLDENYLLRLVEGMTFSGIVLEAFRGKIPNKNGLKSSIYRKTINYLKHLKMESRNKRFYNARQNGIRLAMQEISTW